MTYLLRFLVLTGLALALSACGGADQETAPAPEPEQTVETAPAPQRAEPADPPPPALEADPAAEDDALARARAQRESLRGTRSEEVAWWDDEELAARLGLDPDQRATLLEVREALHDARLEGRTQLRELRGQARGLEGDADRLAELQTSIGQVREQMEEAETSWQETVRVTLSPTQLEQLEEWLDAPP